VEKLGLVALVEELIRCGCDDVSRKLACGSIASLSETDNRGRPVAIIYHTRRKYLQLCTIARACFRTLAPNSRCGDHLVSLTAVSKSSADIVHGTLHSARGRHDVLP
jgi:hypothetical protein